MDSTTLYINQTVKLKDNQFILNNKETLSTKEDGFSPLGKAAYKHLKSLYPKYYKMDPLCKMAFLCSEFILSGTELSDEQKEKTALIFANSSSTFATDKKFHAGIGEIPSPALFVYTLPNILIGEVSIRNGLKGENAFFIEPKFNALLLVEQISTIFDTTDTELCLAGWLDYYDNTNYEGLMILVSRKPDNRILNSEQLNNIYN